MRIDIGISMEHRQKQRLFLDYFNAYLRESTSGYRGKFRYLDDGSFESSIRADFVADDSTFFLTWQVHWSPDHTLQYIEVSGGGEDDEEAGWRDYVHRLVTRSLAAALSTRQERFFKRRVFYYVGPPLDGEYWLRGFRFAPAIEDPHPRLYAERAVVLDADLEAIDKLHSEAIASEFFNRQIARLSLILGIGFYRSEQVMRWVSIESEDSEWRSERHFLGLRIPGPVVESMPKKGELCQLGKWKGALHGNGLIAGEPLSIPRETRKILRRFDEAEPRMTQAFDQCARLYQVSRVVEMRYPSVGLSYRIAAVEAIAKTLPAFEGFSDFVREFVDRPGLDAVLEVAYGSIRSAHFHSGKFPSGEFAVPRHFDPIRDSEVVDRWNLHGAIHEITREAIASWLLDCISE